MFATTDPKPAFSIGSTSNTGPTQGQVGQAGATALAGTQASQPGQSNALGANTGVPAGVQNNAANASNGKSLFGAPTTNTTGGLFGAQNSAAPGGSSLFGGQNTTQAPGSASFGTQNNNAGGGLFGNASTSTGGLFGAKPAATGGLFGTQNAHAPGAGTFGASGSANTFTTGMGGQTQSNTQSLWGPKPAGVSLGALTAPAASPMMQHAYYQRERYNELPDAQRSLLDTMDKFISSQTQIMYELRARDASEEMCRLMTDVHTLISTQQSLSATLEADTMRLQAVTAKVEKDRHDNAMLHQVATHAKEKLSDGSSFLDWLRRFYENIAEEDLARIQRYRLTMEQLERHLISLDQREQFAPQVISDIIRNQNASFMAMAEQVATLHADIETLKKDYIKWYQTRFQSVRDPFAPVAAASDRS
ncbi:glutathionyl-hydroquinone reductase [Malassezia nana]|uniref:Glutathionyl-hydroquinone reductase n=1 Tax=Malassezia nana TaxID=180528 RepID=A0AAF0EHS3_9BASI|nr:glutathionyl-hydroquinone reductase [Malassezia nana]